jgi:hypothetical protein
MSENAKYDLDPFLEELNRRKNEMEKQDPK